MTTAARNILIDNPAVRKKVDDLAKSAEQFVARGAQENRSGTARSAVTLAGAGALGVAFPKAVAVGGTALAATSAYALLAEQLAATVAGKTPTFVARVLKRLPGQAGRTAVAEDELEVVEP